MRIVAVAINVAEAVHRFGVAMRYSAVQGAGQPSQMRRISMRAYRIALTMIATLPMLGACATDDRGGRPGYNSRGDGYRGDRYDRDRSHDGNRQRYRRHLGDNDLIYRGNDGRYYCKRDDGTTGTIVGALAGGVLGNVIAPGGSKTLGTIIGAVGGGVAGRAIDRDDVGCE